MDSAAAPPGSSQGAAGAAQPDPLSGQQALRAGAPMGNGVVSAAPAPAVVPPPDGGEPLLPIEPLERIDAAPADGELLPIPPLSVGDDEPSARHSQAAAPQQVVKAELPAPSLPIAALDLSSQPVVKAEQPTPSAPGLLLPEPGPLPPQQPGLPTQQPPLLQREQPAASSQPEDAAGRSAAQAPPTTVPALPPAQPAVLPQPMPSRAVGVSPGYLPIPGPAGGTLPLPDPAVAAPSIAHQASLSPALLPPPRPGLQRVNSQSPAIRPGLQPANPALVAAAHPGMVPSATPSAAVSPYPVAPLAAASAAMPLAQPYRAAPQVVAAYPQPQQHTQQQPPGQPPSVPSRSPPPTGVAAATAAAPAPALAMPLGYGFTTSQLTCLRQQIMTFRKLKVCCAEARSGTMVQ